MSYINDALRKAQKDKKTDYPLYEAMVSAPEKKERRTRKGFVAAGIVMLFLWVAVGIALLYEPAEKKAPVRVDLSTAKEVIVTPAVPQPVAEMTGLEGTKETASEAKAAPNDIKEGQGKSDPQALYAQAVRTYREGNLQEAKKLYKDVIRIDPKNVQALNNLGVVYMDLNVYKWAVIRLNDALKIKYDYPEAHYNLACLYARQHEKEKSLAHLKNAIGFDPHAKAWARNDKDFSAYADLPEFKKLLEKK